MKIGEIVPCQIIKIKAYGIYLQYQDKVIFCHISNCSNKYIKNLFNEFKLNEKVNVKIIDMTDQGIVGSIKDANSKKNIEKSFNDLMNDFLKESNDKMQDILNRNKKRTK